MKDFKKGNARYNTAAIEAAYQKQLRSDRYTLSHPTKDVAYTPAEIRNNVEVLTIVSDTLTKMKREQEDLIAIKRTQQLGLEYNSPYVVDKVYEDQGGIYAVAIKILLEELNIAINKCPEYNYPPLAEPLRSAFSNAAMIEIKLNDPIEINKTVTDVLGQSWDIYGNTGLKYNSIQIKPEPYAGSPEELSAAVAATRQILHYGDKRVGDSATRFWYNGLYRIAREDGKVVKWRKGWGSPRRDVEEEARRVALYFSIIRTRLEELSGKPAYWYLLNYGNTNVDRMSASNKGGKGMPSNPPTHFVERAENRIRKIILERNFKRTEPIGYGNYRKHPKYIDLGEYIRKQREVLKELVKTIGEVNKAKHYFNTLLTNIENSKPKTPKTIHPIRPGDLPPENLPPIEPPTPEDLRLQTALNQVDVAVQSILLERIRPLKLATKLSNEEGLYVRAKLSQFIVEMAANKVPPARLYIISKDDVQLRLRTKAVVEQLQEEIDELRSNTTAETLEKLFADMSKTLTTIQALRRAKELASLASRSRK